MLLESIFGQMLNYYLWLLGLTLAFSSSVIFFKLYLRSKGTPLGRVAFYVSINSFLWSIAIAVLLVPSMTMSGVYTDVFLVGVFLGGRRIYRRGVLPSDDSVASHAEWRWEISRPSRLLCIVRFGICSCLPKCYSLCVKHSHLDRSNEGTIDLWRGRDHLPYWIPHHATPIKTSS